MCFMHGQAYYPLILSRTLAHTHKHCKFVPHQRRAVNSVTAHTHTCTHTHANTQTLMECVPVPEACSLPASSTALSIHSKQWQWAKTRPSLAGTVSPPPCAPGEAAVQCGLQQYNEGAATQLNPQFGV